MAAFCSLEEAYGNDYKSFLSPASLEPNWLAQRKQQEVIKARQWTQVPSGASFNTNDYQPLVESFTDKTSKPNEEEDSDLYVTSYDEFNIPFKTAKQPAPVKENFDDYYNLINGQYGDDKPGTHNDTFHPGYTASGDYETESPYTAARPSLGCQRLDSLKDHILRCKECKIKIKKLLDEIEGKSDSKDDGGLTNGLLSKLIDSTSINPSSSTSPNPYKSYIELIFFIAIGVFIIFILDTFVRLGKVFSSKK